jgi:hypothetical protein
MAKVNFSFQGWINSADIKEVTVTETVNDLNVEGVPGDELVVKLNSGEWTIALGDHLYNNRKNEIEMFDFDIH